MTNLYSILKNKDLTLLTKVHLVKAMAFPIVMHGCESWTIKMAECQELMFLTVVLGKTLESPLDSKEIKPVNPRGNQSWIYIGRADAEAETPVFWPPDAQSWLFRKDPDAGKDWRWGERNDRGWDDWLASPTQWTCVWASSGRWWRTGKPGALHSHNWVTEQQQQYLIPGYPWPNCKINPLLECWWSWSNLFRYLYLHSKFIRMTKVIILLRLIIIFDNDG